MKRTKIKKMLKNYTNIIDELRDQVLFITDEKSFVMSKDFTIIKFKTTDTLPFNKKIDVSVCAISLYSLFEKNGVYYPQIELQDGFYENDGDNEY